MFKKPFTVKSQTRMRSSDVRKFRSEVQETFLSAAAPEFQQPKTGSSAECDERLQTLLDRIAGSKHAEVTVSKIVTHGGQHGQLFRVGGTPFFFRIDDMPLLPTVYSLWAAAKAGFRLVPFVATPKAVLPRLFNGADLMLPGTFVPADGVGGSFEKGQVVAVSETGAEKVMQAVGLAHVSLADIVQAGRLPETQGKSIHILHTHNDQLWASGDRSEPPTSAEIPQSAQTNVASGVTAPLRKLDSAEGESAFARNHDWTLLEAEMEPDIYSLPESSVQSLAEEFEDVRVDEDAYDGDDLDLAVVDNDGLREPDAKLDHAASAATDILPSAVSSSVENNAVSAPAAETEHEPELSPQEHDRILESAFMTAVCTRFKDDPRLLPITGSTMFSVHIMPCREQNTTINFKKTSFKKLSKFYRSLEKRGVIKVKDQNGDLRITSINFSHPSIVSFDPPRRLAGTSSSSIDSKSTQQKSSENVSDPNTATVSDRSYTPLKPLGKLEADELFKIPKNDQLRHFFKEAMGPGFAMDELLKAADVRAAIKQYIKKYDLVVAENQRMVRLDMTLRQFVLTREETAAGNVDDLRRDQLVQRITEKLLPHHSVYFIVNSNKKNEEPVTTTPDVRKGAIVPIHVETRRRGGRVVTVINNAEKYMNDLDALAQEFRHKLAASASVMPAQNGVVEIVIQGVKAYEVCQVLDRILGVSIPAGLKPVRKGHNAATKEFVGKLLVVKSIQ